jgi:transposase
MAGLRLTSRFLLAQQLAHIDALNADIEAVTVEIEARLQPRQDEIGRLDTIPGVEKLSACAILAEIGHRHVQIREA